MYRLQERTLGPCSLPLLLPIENSLLPTAGLDGVDDEGPLVVEERGRFSRSGNGGTSDFDLLLFGYFSFNFCMLTGSPFSFAFRRRVARSGLLEVPGDRYSDLRFVFTLEAARFEAPA